MLTDDPRREVTLPPPRIALPDTAAARDGHAAALGVRSSVDDTDRPVDVVDLLSLEPFLTGSQPYARSVGLDDVLGEAALLPPDAQLLRHVVDGTTRAMLAVGAGWTLKVTHFQRRRHADLTVTAVDDDLARSVLEAATEGAVERRETTSDEVSMGLWYMGPHGPRYKPRMIEAPVWERIGGNYPQAVSTAVSSLVARRATEAGGRVLLLHGPPGTGKTTLLRSLAHAWQSWCRTDCVLDPDRLFADPAYLLELATAEPVPDDDEERAADVPLWRLLVLEDCDELIRAEAKAATGQALSRLLNLTDGILGQGTRVLVAVTTNEPLAALHPAVLRPGRCLAQLEVGRLSSQECARWMADHDGDPAAVPSGGATLAELYALLSVGADGTAPLEVVIDRTAGTGLYL